MSDIRGKVPLPLLNWSPRSLGRCCFITLTAGWLAFSSACGAPQAPGPTAEPPAAMPTVDRYRFDPGTSPQTVATYTATRAQCRLEDPLTRLLSFPDKERIARDYGLEYDGKTVWVVIRGMPGADWDALTRRYHLQPGAKGGDSMEAHVPLQDLCALSNDSGVRIVEQPMIHKPS